MDRKNTMLLTVIAVATLLVAVVGATFAYFSVSGGSSFTTVTATAQTASIGGVTLTSTSQAMNIYVTAADMAESAIGSSYYSTTTAITAGTSNYTTTASPITIATATTSGGESTTKYACSFTLVATVSGDMAANLVAGDAELYLNGMSITATTYDLVTDATTLANGISVSTTLTGSSDSSTIEGYIVLHNTDSSQDAIAGQTLTVSLTTGNDWTCEATA